MIEREIHISDMEESNETKPQTNEIFVFTDFFFFGKVQR